MVIITLLALLVTLIPVESSALSQKSFRQAKQGMLRVYARDKETFYCGCKYYEQDGTSDPSLSSCRYEPRKNAKRASRLEWDHVVPASYFGKMMPCWEKGGRKECKKYPLFKQMEADMHNLVPSIGEINGDKSNYLFDEIPGEARKYGSCDFEVDTKKRVVEPREEIRGDIARKWFYMSEKYSMPMPQSLYLRMKLWHENDPVTYEERALNQRIGWIQGNENKYVKDRDLQVVGIENQKAFVR